MAGVLIHLLAGSAMAFAGRYYFDDYFKGTKYRERFYLAAVCLLFSIVPDVFLGLYYTFPQSIVYNSMVGFHILLHAIFIPIAIASLVLLKYKYDIKYEPIVAMGFWCILLHIAMDYLIVESSVFI